MQDYYGITFPGPTAALSNRDGSLANNPYSGKSFCVPDLRKIPKPRSDPTTSRVAQVKSPSSPGTTPPLPHHPQAWRGPSLPKARARASLSLPRPSLSRRASHSITAVSRPSCLQATATRACLIMPGCPAPLPSSMAPPCLFLQGVQDQLQPNNTVWDWVWVWQTPQRVLSSSRRSSSPAVTVSTPSAQVNHPVPNSITLL